jgi:hypothetical protein
VCSRLYYPSLCKYTLWRSYNDIVKWRISVLVTCLFVTSSLQMQRKSQKVPTWYFLRSHDSFVLGQQRSDLCVDIKYREVLRRVTMYASRGNATAVTRQKMWHMYSSRNVCTDKTRRGNSLTVTYLAPRPLHCCRICQIYQPLESLLNYECNESFLWFHSSMYHLSPLVL